MEESLASKVFLLLLALIEKRELVYKLFPFLILIIACQYTPRFISFCEAREKAGSACVGSTASTQLGRLEIRVSSIPILRGRRCLPMTPRAY